MLDVRENQESEERLGLDQDSGPMEVIDIGLGEISTADAQFRFNQDNIYIARETAVLVRCSLVDCVHGKLSLENPVPCTMLVLDFQLDRIKSSRIIHSAIITIITKRIKRILKIAPTERLNADSLELEVEVSNSVGGDIGIDKGMKATISPKHSKNTRATRVKYATAKGWTTHYPRHRPNDPSSHDCIKWSLQENPAKKDEGVPPNFRATVLLERHDDDKFQLEMDIDTTADLLTGLEDLSFKSIEKGRLIIDPSKPSTCRLKTYRAELGEENLSDIIRYSLGTLDDRRFN